MLTEFNKDYTFSLGDVAADVVAADVDVLDKMKTTYPRMITKTQLTPIERGWLPQDKKIADLHNSVMIDHNNN